MPAKLTRENLGRLRRVSAQIARLPTGEQVAWRRLLKEKGLSPSLVLVGADAPPVVPAGSSAAPEAITEWDLSLANWLDNVYTTVADRAEIVAAKAARAASGAGLALIPLVLVAIGVVFVMERRQRLRGG